MLAADYHLDCQHLGHKIFLQAVIESRRRSKWFPKVAELLAIGKELQAAEWARLDALLIEEAPRTFTQKECDDNKAMIAALCNGILEHGHTIDQVIADLAMLKGGKGYRFPE